MSTNRQTLIAQTVKFCLQHESLKRIATPSSDGYVGISHLISCGILQSVTTSMPEIIEALRVSPGLAVSPDGTRVKIVHTAKAVQPLQLGDLRFFSFVEAREMFCRMLSRYNDEDELDANDAKLVKDLYKSARNAGYGTLLSLRVRPPLGMSPAQNCPEARLSLHKDPAPPCPPQEGPPGHDSATWPRPLGHVFPNTGIPRRQGSCGHSDASPYTVAFHWGLQTAHMPTPLGTPRVTSRAVG